MCGKIIPVYFGYVEVIFLSSPLLYMLDNFHNIKLGQKTTKKFHVLCYEPI